jgi:hypothetical protein
MTGTPEEDSWQGLNYFNYFTEVEEHFQRARGTGLFLLSPLDWALIETWKNAGIPLEAVLRGIDAAFEKWRARRQRTQAINSVAYCAQAVLTEAQAMAGTAQQAAHSAESKAPFPLEDLQRHLASRAAELHAKPGYEEIAASLDRLAASAETEYTDLESLEQRLVTLEQKAAAIARTRQSEDDLLRARQDLDRQLRPYRGKMTAAQLDLLERQYLDRRLFEDAGLPRLSLFYLR